MFTTTASLAASASASTSPSRESSRSGCSFASGMICAGTRSAVLAGQVRRRRSPPPSAAAPRGPPRRGSRSTASPRSRGSSPTSPRCAPRGTPPAPRAGCRPRAASRRTRPATSSRSRATPVAMLTRLCVFELTRYIGRSVRPCSARRVVHRASTSAASCARSRPGCRPASARAGSSGARRSGAARSSKRSPQASRSRAQSSGEPPSACAHSSGVGGWSGGQPAARWRTRSLFHSIWNATSVGIRSSTSEALASSTACMPWPLSCQRRRRAGASASSHSSIWIPLRAKTSASWPMITRSAPAIASGRRRIA